MFKYILIKELFSHLKGYKFNIVFISCVILLGINQLITYQNYSLTTADSKLPFPHEEQPISKGKSPLSIYVTGTSELMDRIFKYDDNSASFIELHLLKTDIFQQYFPMIDFNYLVRIIISFLAMVVGFDTFCGEKQNGTLKLILSNSVDRFSIVLGKFLGNLIILVVPILIVSLLYYLVISLKSDINFTATDNIRIISIMIVCIVYVSIFLLISMAISASSSNAVTSIIKNFAVWMLLVFVISNPLSIVYGKEKLPDGRSILDKYHLSMIEHVDSTNIQDARKKAFYDYKAAVLDYRNKLNKKIRTIEYSSMIVPTDAFNLCLTSLSNCGLRDEEHFRNAILRYHVDRREKADTKFIYSGIGLKESLLYGFKYFIVLLIWSFIFFIVTVVKFNKYDIR